MIYIEEVILVDLIIHIIILKLCCYLNYLYVYKLNLAFSSLVSIGVVLLYMFFHFNPIWGCLMGFFTSLLSFRGSLKSVIKANVMYFLFNYLLGGVCSIIYFSTKINIYIILSVLSIIVFVTLLYCSLYKKGVNKNFKYQMIIENNDIKKTIVAYLDTGNFMQSSDYLPIMVLDTKYKEGNPVNKLMVNSISGSKVIFLYRFKHVYIKLNGKFKEVDCLVTFQPISFDAMIGLKMIGE